MGNGWAPKYTRAQRDAVIAAALDHGYNAPQVVRAAAAGELPGRGCDLEPFVMPVTTARHYISERRRRVRADQTAAQEPASALERHAGRLLALLDKATTGAERTQRGRKLDPLQIRDLARAAREVDALHKQLRVPAPVPRDSKRNGTAKTSSTPDSGLLDKFASEDRAKKTAPPSLPQHIEREGSATEGAAQQNAHTDDSLEDGSAAVSRAALRSEHIAAEITAAARAAGGEHTAAHDGASSAV